MLAGVRITGTVDSEFNGETRTFPFEIQVEEPRYQLRTIHTNPDGKEVIHITGSDGLDSYKLIRFEEAGGNKEFGFVTEGVFPEAHHTLGQLIWLAFASSRFLEEHENQRGGLTLHGFSINEEIYGDVSIDTVTKDRSGLPSEVSWIGPSTHKAPDGSQFNDWKPRYPAAQFKILSRYQEGGLDLPGVFEYRRFSPPHVKPVGVKSPPASPLVTEVFRGRVESATRMPVAERGDFLPEITAKQVRVVEKRFERSVGELHGYRIKDQAWKKRTNEEILEWLKSVKSRSRK